MKKTPKKLTLPKIDFLLHGLVKTKLKFDKHFIIS